MIGTVEISDPDGSSFTIVGSLREARAGHTETLLPDGQVLLVGGDNASEAMVRDSAELFDPNAIVITPGATDPSPPR